MPTKKNVPKRLFENMPVEPDQGNVRNSELQSGNEDPGGENLTEQTQLMPVSSDADDTSAGNEDAGKDDTADDHVSGDDLFPEDILDDVRRSLIEEEAHEKNGQPKWWQRIGRGSRKNNVEEGSPKAVEEISLPRLDVDGTVEDVNPEPEPDEYVDPIDELIDILDKEEIIVRKPPAEEEKPVEPEKIPSLDELKKQAFQPRSSTPDENLTEVRTIALEGDEEVFVEVQSTQQDPFEDRINAVENAIKPYQRYIYFGIAVLGLVMAVIAGMVIINVYRQTVAVPTPEVVSNLPYPTTVSLPGGWAFNLGKGDLVDGRWNPKGAEWLQGTEVCRWVALPWSRQLEAVIRTLNPDDPIDLGMSNKDILTYKVDSIRQMSPEEMQRLDTNSPCLLIVLAEPDTEQRWVLTALP